MLQFLSTKTSKLVWHNQVFWFSLLINHFPQNLKDIINAKPLELES